MAAKKKAKSKTKVVSKAKVAGKAVAKKAKAGGKKVVKKVAKTLLGRIAQRSAQLVLDSGILGEVPKRRAPAKKKARKA
jgi:hypothetical protein